MEGAFDQVGQGMAAQQAQARLDAYLDDDPGSMTDNTKWTGMGQGVGMAGGSNVG